MDFKENFQTPFDCKGEPRKYLRLILPFLEKERATKKDMLRWMGVNLDLEPKKRNNYSKLLAKLSKEGVLYTKPQGDGTWKRGENFNRFIGWIAENMLDNKSTKSKFKNMLFKMDSNGLDFIMKD